MRTSVLLASAALVLAACDTAAPPASDTEIATDRDLYHAVVTSESVRFHVDLTYTNTSGAPVYFTGCYPPVNPTLEKWVGGEWVVAFSPVHLLCLSEPVRVGPGASLEYALHVYACTRERCAPDWLPGPTPHTVPGTYRVRDAVGTDLEGGLPETSRTVVSNSFRVEVAGGLR